MNVLAHVLDTRTPAIAQKYGTRATSQIFSYTNFVTKNQHKNQL